MQTNKTLIFDKNADNIFKKGDYVNSYMVIDLKSINLDFQIEEQNTKYNLIATLTDTNNNPIPNNIIEFYKTINDDNCVIDFESDKESVRNNQICILTATVTQNNNPLENILVQFYNDDVLIGESTTNEDGQALFEYVGYGTDDIIITAKSDNIISNSVNLGNYSDVTKNIELDNTNNIVQIDDMLVLTAHILDEYQQPYENLNVSFIQKNKQLFTNSCKSGVTDVDQWVAQSGSSVTRESDGSVFATTGTATGFIWANKTGTSTSSALGDYYGDCVVEMDILSTDNQYNGIMFYETNRTGAKVTIFYPPTNHSTGHYKIVKTGNNFKAYIDDVQVNDRDFELEEPYRIGVRVASGVHNIKIANFSIVGDEPVYPITDTLFFDTGVTGDTNPNWYDNNYGTVSVGSDGTLLTSTNTTNFLMHNASNSSHTSSDQYIWNTPFIVEFDVVSMSGTGTDTQFQVYSDETTKNWATGLSGVGHYKAIVLDDNQRLYKDGELQTNSQSYSLPNCRITLRVRNNVSLKYKNFKVYEIAENSITDVNGIATCQLVGDGSGLETYSSKCENIESEPIEIIDGLFYDKAVIGSSSSDWINSSNRLTVTVQSDGTLLETSSDLNGYYLANLKGTSTGSVANARDYTAPICVELDYVEKNRTHSGGSGFYGLFFNDGTDHRINLMDINPDVNHLKVIVDGTNAICYADDSEEPVILPLELTGDIAVGLVVRSSSYVKFKDFVIYPIESEEEPTPVEEILYENSAEVSRTSKNGSTIYDNNMSVQLPTNAEITFDIYSTNSTSGSEHRFFLLPKTQYNSGTTQPTEALYIDLLSNNKAQIGKRENNSTYYWVQNISATSSTYHTVKIVKTGTSISFYLDGTLLTTQTISWIDNHSDYCLSMMRWSASGTSSIKNVIIKKYNN